jgi:hypothetical protein
MAGAERMCITVKMLHETVAQGVLYKQTVVSLNLMSFRDDDVKPSLTERVVPGPCMPEDLSCRLCRAKL